MKKKNAITLSAVIGCAIIALVIAQTDPTGDASNDLTDAQLAEALKAEVQDYEKNANEMDAESQKRIDELSNRRQGA